MSSKLTRAGDVSVEYIYIVSNNGLKTNITNQVESFTIYEDLFDNFLSGTILINDAQSLSNLFPLVGQEFIGLSFITPSLDENFRYKGEFYIDRCSENLSPNSRTSLYELHFVSKEAIIDLNTKLSRAYRGTGSSMIKEIVKGEDGLQSTKELNVEDSANSFKFVSNWWKPTKCIQYVTAHSINSNNSPSYLFFENAYGFHFVTLDSLFSEELPCYQDFYVGDFGGIEKNFENDYKKVININYYDGYDYVRRVKEGYYGGEVITWDTTTQQYVHNRRYRDFTSDSHLNKNDPIPTNIPVETRSFIEFVPKSYNTFTDVGDHTDAKNRIDRRQILSRIDTTKVVIEVDGRTDYGVGMKVSLTVPKNTEHREDVNNIDHLLSGYYIITSCAHTVQKNKHRCVIELCKDSFSVDINSSIADGKSDGRTITE